MTAQVIVFRCGGFAAATKNIFFMFFLPCWGGFRRFPRRRPEKAKLQGGVRYVPFLWAQGFPTSANSRRTENLATCAVTVSVAAWSCPLSPDVLPATFRRIWRIVRWKPMIDEATWIQQAQKGDTDAFTRLVQLYQAPVYNLAYRMLGERMEAEDAAQETFLRAFRNLGQYDPARPFRNWLLSITAHYCVDRLRRQRPLLALDDELATGRVGANPDDAVIAWEARERIQRLADVPPRRGPGGGDSAILVRLLLRGDGPDSGHHGQCSEIPAPSGPSGAGPDAGRGRSRGI